MRYFYTILCLLFATMFYGQTVIPPSQDFQITSGSPPLPAGYTQTANWTTSSTAPNSSSYSGASGLKYARGIRGGAGTYILQSGVLSTVGYTGITVTFGNREQTSSATDFLTVQWSDNGGAFQNITTTLDPTTSWSKFISATLPVAADNNANIRLRFVVTGNGGSSGAANSFWIDDVSLEGTPTSILEFYSNSSGFLDDIATWGSNTDGTGTNPISFNEPDYIFHVSNNPTPTLNGDLTIDGSGATMIIESGSNFIIPAAFKFDNCIACASIDINTGGELSIANLNNADFPKIGAVNTNSTINYSGLGAQIVNGNIDYQNLILSGSGIKTCAVGQNIEVNNNFDLQTGVTFELHKTPGNTNKFILLGSSLGAAGEVDCNANSEMVIDGNANASGNLRFKSGSLLGVLDFQATNTVLATESNLNVVQLKYKSPNSSILQVLGVSKLTISGEISTRLLLLPVIPNTMTLSGGPDAELEINGAGVNSFDLAMQVDPGDPFLNAFKNITLNRSGVTMTLTSELIALNNVDVQAGIIAANGNLTLYSDANNTARILALSPSNAPISDVTGAVKINRFNGAGFTGWTTLASPVKSATFAQIDDDIAVTCGNCPDGDGAGGSQFTSVYTYDETQSGAFDDFNSYVPINDINDAFTNGVGYFVYFGNDQVSSSDITWETQGNISSDEVRTQLTATPGANGITFDPIDDGFSLVGNPYPAPISWDEVFNVTANDISNGPDPIYNSYFIFSPDQNGGAGGYYSYVDGTSETPGIMDDGIIPMGQGFYVQSQGPAGRLVDLVFTESAKSALNTNYYLKTANTNTTVNQDCYLKMTRSSDSKNVTTAVTFKEQATENRDLKYDAVYKNGLPAAMAVNPNAMQFYTILNGVKYSINAIPPVNGSISLDLYSKVGTSGDYTISAANLNSIPAGYCLDLFDKSDLSHHDLKASDYTCTLNSSDITSRFILTFSNSSFDLSTKAQAPQCNSSATGSITAKVNGNGPFDFVWRDAKNQIVAQTKNSNNNSNTVSNLLGGDYKVEVSKMNQCATATKTIQLQGIDAAKADFTLPSVSNIGNNGVAAIVFPNTSTHATEFTWDFGDGKKLVTDNAVSVSHNYAKAGTYKVSLEAKNANCEDVSKVSQYLKVQDPQALGLNNLDNVKIWKDRNDNLNIVFDNIISNGSIEIYNLVGQKVFEYSLKDNQQKDVVLKQISSSISHQIGIVKLKTTNKEVAKRIAF
jgi:PKD repeat protein